MLFIGCLVAFFGYKRHAAPKVEAPAAPELEVVVTNRIADPVYRQAMESNRLVQVKMASARSVVVEKMEKIVAEVRSALPAGADVATVKAELEKRPEWKALEAENDRILGEMRQTLAGARETVGQRIRAEQRDMRAVAEGRAVPADGEKNSRRRQ
jgi:hypothetical protein